MTQASKLVTVIGGSGFVGRYVAQKMARRGWRVRVACRRPNDAMFVKLYGVVGQVEPVQCNIRDDASTRAVIAGSDAVVNCVGVLWQAGKNTFDACQAEGAERIARIAAEEGVSQLVHISAIGADPNSESEYARTKAEGEAAILQHKPDAMVLRPSIVFGTEDGFFNEFAGMARLTPILPLVGASTKFQPVWVEDVAEAAALGAAGEKPGGIYELGGPRVASFKACMSLMLKITRRRRFLLDIPPFFARIMAFFLEKTGWIGVKPVMTGDQIKLLQVDNVVFNDSKSFADLGIEPTAMETILESYLYAYRPYGQYTALSETGGAGA